MKLKNIRTGRLMSVQFRNPRAGVFNDYRTWSFLRKIDSTQTGLYGLFAKCDEGWIGHVSGRVAVQLPE